MSDRRVTRSSVNMSKRKSVDDDHDDEPPQKNRNDQESDQESQRDDVDAQKDNASESEQATATSVNNPWVLDCNFPDREKFDEFLKKEGCWSIIAGPLNQNKGVTTVYRCNKVKRRGTQCVSGLKTLHDFAPDDPTIRVFRRLLTHDCDQSTNLNNSVPEEIQEFIISQSEIGQTTVGIAMHVRERYPDSTVTAKQITNVINYYRKKAFGNQQVTLQDMQAFFDDNKAIPDDIDEPFILNFDRSAPQSEEKFFRMIYTTKRLLQYAQGAKSLHVDGTYKIVIQGFPVIVIGFSDLENTFHLSGLGLVSGKGAADYQFMFESLRNGVVEVTDDEMQPDAVVADSAASISKAVKDTFDGAVTRIHCWAHVMMNVEKQSFKTPANKSEFKDDVRSLQMSSDQQKFENGCKLLEKKWAKREAEVMKWFKGSYISKNNTWYSGALERTPKTNNVTEAFNRGLKKFQTYYQRKGVNVFMRKGLDIVKQRSKEYLLDKKPPVMSLDYAADKKLMEKTQQYSKLNKSVVSEQEKDNGTKYYVFGGDNAGRITMQDVNKWKSNQASTFNEFKKTMLDIHQIHFKGPNMDLKNAVCTCPDFGKNHCCKHVALIAIRTGLLVPPDDVVQESVAAKNPRGRPRKTTKALIKD